MPWAFICPCHGLPDSSREPCVNHVPNGQKTNDVGKRLVVQHWVFTGARVFRMLFEYTQSRVA